MIQVSIYVLIDPRSEEISYIGYTSTSLRRRLNSHLAALSPNNHEYESLKGLWIRELDRRGLRPRIQLVQTTSVANRVDVSRLERYWYEQFVSLKCPLKNTLVGGTHITILPVSADTRRKIGQAKRGSRLSQAHKEALARGAAEAKVRYRESGVKRRLSDGTRRRMSETHKKRPPKSEITKARLSRAKFDQYYTDEFRREVVRVARATSVKLATAQFKLNDDTIRRWLKLF
jgi:hypothetical protein